MSTPVSGSPYWTPTGGGTSRPRRFSGPGWRIAGAIVAWLMFAYSFTVLYQGISILSNLGGFCASGGPYVIETECPAIVSAALPLGFIGVFLSWMIALVFQRGFSAPLVVWGWPILFVGLGLEFFLSIPISGAFVGILCGTLFVVMGIAPLIFELRAGPRRIVLGKTNVNEVRFLDKPGAPRTFYAFGRDDPGETVVPTPGDWLLSLVVSLGSIAAGVALGILTIHPEVLLG